MASGKQTTNYQALGVKERSGSVDEESHSAQELSVIHTADEPDSSSTGMPIELRIGGMMCNHCRSKVEGALAQVPGVESASVDLEKELATVTGTASACRLPWRPYLSTVQAFTRLLTKQPRLEKRRLCGT